MPKLQKTELLSRKLNSWLTGYISFQPAYDLRNHPEGNYGIHGCDINIWLSGPKGGVLMRIFTNWYLKHTNQPPMAPSVSDVSWHYRKKHKDYFHTTKCEVTGGNCWWGERYSENEYLMETLINKGFDGVFEELKTLYLAMRIDK